MHFRSTFSEMCQGGLDTFKYRSNLNVKPYRNIPNSEVFRTEIKSWFTKRDLGYSKSQYNGVTGQVI